MIALPEIVLKNITKRYGKHAAVDHLELVINDRDFITLLGPSGCGKTTTLRMIAGLETPTEGEIYIGGRLVFSSEKGVDVPPDKRDVGFLFQNYALWPHMTVCENITFGLENLKWDKARMQARADELMQMLKIEAYGARYPAELSGGQQQRVAIARTLATGPKTLFMDEPLSNLDAKLRMEMRTELKRLHLETDSTFVYVTHDQLEAMTLSTKICLLRDGRLQQYEPPLMVYNRPANSFAADFIGSPNINLLPAVAAAVEGRRIALDLQNLSLQFTACQEHSVTAGQRLLLGVRPENIVIGSAGELSASVYSTLPSGMETILRIETGGVFLTAVVFGDIDFQVNQSVGARIQSEKNILFDAETGVNLIGGSVTAAI